MSRSPRHEGRPYLIYASDLAALRIERAPGRRTGRRVGWLLLVMMASAGGLAAWQWAARAQLLEVETAIVSERAAGNQAAILNATGYVTARRRATVASKITGKLIGVNVEEGMAVREGQILARLDDAALRATLALTDAQVRPPIAAYARTKSASTRRS
jgi:HlyD family secretion protein